MVTRIKFNGDLKAEAVKLVKDRDVSVAQAALREEKYGR